MASPPRAAGTRTRRWRTSRSRRQGRTGPRGTGCPSDAAGGAAVSRACTVSRSVLRLQVGEPFREGRAPRLLNRRGELGVAPLHGVDEGLEERRVVRRVDPQVPAAVAFGDAREDRRLGFGVRGG